MKKVLLLITVALLAAALIFCAGCITIINSPAESTALPTQTANPAVTPEETNAPGLTLDDIAGKVYAVTNIDGFDSEMKVSVRNDAKGFTLRITPGKKIDYTIHSLGLAIGEDDELTGGEDTSIEGDILYAGATENTFVCTPAKYSSHYDAVMTAAWVYTYDKRGAHGTSGPSFRTNEPGDDATGTLIIIDENTIEVSFSRTNPFTQEIQLFAGKEPVILTGI